MNQVRIAKQQRHNSAQDAAERAGQYAQDDAYEQQRQERCSESQTERDDLLDIVESTLDEIDDVLSGGGRMIFAGSLAMGERGMHLVE